MEIAKWCKNIVLLCNIGLVGGVVLLNFANTPFSGYIIAKHRAQKKETEIKSTSFFHNHYG